MKREEKNIQTRRRILDSALSEFAEKGYGGSSVNTICGAEGISKGIIYHYFKTKDELYLACVEECFQMLTEYLENHLSQDGTAVDGQLETYFDIRLSFFRLNPIYQKIFCEAVVMPPERLRGEIAKCRETFDLLNIGILKRLLKSLKLRADMSMDEVIDTFRLYQDFINAKYQMTGVREIDIREHEESCHRAVGILLYGVVERGDSA